MRTASSGCWRGVILACLLVGAAAQAGHDDYVHPRRAWVVGPGLEAPAVLLGPRVAWVSVAGAFERVCAGQAGCMPVLHWEPAREGYLPRGFVLYLRRPGLPLTLPPWRDSLGWKLGEARSMEADPVLRPLAQALEAYFFARMPPMHDPGLGTGGGSGGDEPSAPAAWIQKGEGPWHWEVGFSLDPGVFAESGDKDEDTEARFLYGGSFRVGFRNQVRVGSSSSGCIQGILDAIWEFMAGNQYGADLRVHAWREGDRTRFGIGVQPVIRLVWDDHAGRTLARIRTFAAFGVLLPEVGYTFDNHGDQAVYLQFVEPVAIMLTSDVALDIRGGIGYVFAGDRDGVIGTLGLGLLFR